MKVTILLGNGFDLNQGLKTSYYGFLSEYTKNNKKDSQEIAFFKKLLKENGNLWSDFELLLGKITTRYTVDEKEELLKVIKDMRHAMSAYLLKESQVFKHKIHRYRKELIFSLDNMFYREGYMYPPIDVLATDRNMHYQFLVFNYNAIIYDIINKVKRKEVTRNKNRITDKIDSTRHLLHDDTLAGFILGVNDNSQIENNSLRNDPDICNALIKETQRRIMYQEKFANVIKDSDAVYIYGMSIGLTDKYYWEQIIQWLKSDSEKKLIIASYDKAISGIDLSEIAKKENIILDRLKKLGLEDAESKKVQLVINPKIFNFTQKGRKRRR